ncbi:MAG: hypothetical protein RI908_709, partial [Actinomycetota bacterium]
SWVWPRAGRGAPTGTSAIPTVNAFVAVRSELKSVHQSTWPVVSSFHDSVGQSDARRKTAFDSPTASNLIGLPDGA